MTPTDEDMERAQTARVIASADRVVASATALADAVERLDAPTLRARLAAAEAALATLTAQLRSIADEPGWFGEMRFAEDTDADFLLRVIAAIRARARQSLSRLTGGEG